MPFAYKHSSVQTHHWRLADDSALRQSGGRGWTETHLSLPSGQEPQFYFLTRGERSFLPLKAGSELTNRGEKMLILLSGLGQLAEGLHWDPSLRAGGI